MTDDQTFIEWVREWIDNGGRVEMVKDVDPVPMGRNGLFPLSEQAFKNGPKP